MYRSFFLSFIFFISIYNIPFAQNSGCTPPEDKKVDYSFTMEEIANRCAWFTDKSETYILHKSDQKGKKMDVSLSFPAEKESSIAYLVRLANEHKKDLTTSDILFVQAALDKWEIEKQKIGFEMTESGLGIKILKQGDGKLPEKGKNVSVHYHGYLENGNTFDSSFERGQPFQFPLGAGRVIKGWDEGIAKLPVGTEAILRIPPELGYGSRGAGASIPPNSTLFFRVQVMGAD